MPLRDLAARYAPLVERLLLARRAGRIAHAYLLTGDNLELLEALATGWIQASVCQQPTAEADACGTCLPCRQVAGGRYPYLEQRRPESKSRVIKIEHIRELERRLYLTSDGQLKVGLILSADRMTEEAQNAFLKTLEEPPKNTILLLLTINPNALLATIRSRCQTIAIMDNRLVYRFPDQEAFFRGLARLVPGSGVNAGIQAADHLGAAFKRLQGEAEAATKEQIVAMRAQYAQLDAPEKKRVDAECDGVVAAEYLGRREQLLSAIHSWFAMQLLRASGVPAELLPNPEIVEVFAGKLPPAPDIPAAQRSLRLTDELISHLRFNVDEALALQDYCQKICARKT